MKCRNKGCAVVANDSKICPNCCKAMYCSDNCLKTDWEVHKFLCTPHVFILKDLVPVKDSPNKTVLGKGAYGEVQLVQHVRSKIQYALKIIRKDQINSQTPIEIFLREISIHKSLVHPNIARLYDHLEDRQKIYLILEYVEKGSVSSLLKKKIKLSEMEACEVFKQVCVGVSFLHEQQVIHRDIKSENLLVSKDGTVKLCDFGWCAYGLQSRGTFCGTADYMAPEMSTCETYNHKVDVWALGVLLYELVHGRPPFLGVGVFDKLREIETGNIPIRTSLSPELTSLIHLILNKNPDERPEVKEILKSTWFSDKLCCKFRVGNRVKHNEYGGGTVVGTQGNVCTIEFNGRMIEIIDNEVLRTCEVLDNRAIVAKSQELKSKPPLSRGPDQSPKITISKVSSNKEFIKRNLLPKRTCALNTSVESLLRPKSTKRKTAFDLSFESLLDVSSCSPSQKKRNRSPFV